MTEEETPEPTNTEPVRKSIWADLVTFSNDVWWGGPVEVSEPDAPDSDDSPP